MTRIEKLKQCVASMIEKRNSNQQVEKHNKLIFDLFTALAVSILINLSLTELTYQKGTLRVARVSGYYNSIKTMVQRLRYLPFATGCQLTLVRRENHTLIFELVIQL